MIGFNAQEDWLVVDYSSYNVNESNGKLELDNWIQIWIAHVINQTQAMFKVIQRLLKLERIYLMDSMDKCMSIS